MRFTLALVASAVLAQAVYAEGSASRSHHAHHHSASDEYRGSSSVAPESYSALEFEGALNVQRRSLSDEASASTSADDSEYSSAFGFDYSLGEDSVSSSSVYEDLENYYRRSLSDDPYASNSQDSETSSAYEYSDYSSASDLDYQKRELSSEASYASKSDDVDYLNSFGPEPTEDSSSASFVYDSAYHSELAFELEKRGIVDFFKNLFGGEESSASEVEETSAIPDAYSIAAHSAAASASASVHDVATKAHAAASSAAAQASSKVHSAIAAGHDLHKRDGDAEAASSVDEAFSSIADSDAYESSDAPLRSNRAAKAAQKNVASRSSAAASSASAAALRRKRRDLSGYYSEAGHVVFGSEGAHSETASAPEAESTYNEAGHVVFESGGAQSFDAESTSSAEDKSAEEEPVEETTASAEDETAETSTSVYAEEPEVTPPPHHGKSKEHHGHNVHKRDSESAIDESASDESFSAQSASAESSSDEFAFLESDVDVLLERREFSEEASQSSSASAISDEFAFLNSDVDVLLERREFSDEATQTTDFASSIQAAAVETSASVGIEEDPSLALEAMLESWDKESAELTKDQVKENSREDFWIDDASAEDSFKGYDWKNVE